MIESFPLLTTYPLIPEEKALVEYQGFCLFAMSDNGDSEILHRESLYHLHCPNRFCFRLGKLSEHAGWQTNPGIAHTGHKNT